MDELNALMILSHISHLGSTKIRLLIQHYGSALAALQAPSEELSSIFHFGPRILKAWNERVSDEKIDENFRLAERFKVDLITYTDPRYPKNLLKINDYPLILYVKGQLKKEDERSLAVVGTRQATRYGLEMAKELSRNLAQAGFTIISGLARGIDTSAHEGALEGGRTLAILGSGIDRLYPTENKGLGEAIEKKGALISEFPMNVPPDSQNFPQRNRIVSAMSRGTVLIEAPIQSGAMLTVKRTLNQNKPVFALPGRADFESFKGNHFLIKTQQASLIENENDILAYFDCLISPKPKSENLFLMPLQEEEETLFLKIPKQEISIEELVAIVQLPISKLNVLLMSLVLKKRLKEYPGKIYKKIDCS